MAARLLECPERAFYHASTKLRTKFKASDTGRHVILYGVTLICST